MGTSPSSDRGGLFKDVAANVEARIGVLSKRRRRRSFKDVAADVEARTGAIPILARYHQEPNKLEDDYVVDSEVLGSGLSGDVRLGIDRLDPSRKVAVKSFSLCNMSDHKVESLKLEVEHHLSMDHPHIVRLLHVYETEEQHLDLVMEYMSGGDMVDRLQAMGRFTEQEARGSLEQILLALNYLHSIGIVHCDVKADNVIFDTPDSDHLKLLDFGFSQRWNQDSDEQMHAMSGTMQYVAPEVLNGNYTSKCDLWSTGVLAYILLTGTFPFEGSEVRMVDSICKGNYPPMHRSFWSGVSDEAKDFVKLLLQVDPSKRPSAQEALQHPWIARSRPVVQSGMDDIAESLRQYGYALKFRRCQMEMLSWTIPNEVHAKFRSYFLAMNTTQRGVLTFSELRKIMMEQLPKIADAEISQAFQALDTNNDGTIHYSDFLAAMMNSGCTPGRTHATQNIQRNTKVNQSSLSKVQRSEKKVLFKIFKACAGLS